MADDDPKHRRKKANGKPYKRKKRIRAVYKRPWTTKHEEKFLAALRETGHMGLAAQAIRRTTATIANHRARDADFARAIEAALDEAMDMVVEPELIRRGVHGVPKPVYHRGKVVGTTKEYSDHLLMFLLKGAKPDKYKERIQQENTGKGGGPMQVEDVVAMTREQRKARLAELRAKREVSGAETH